MRASFLAFHQGCNEYLARDRDAIRLRVGKQGHRRQDPNDKNSKVLHIHLFK